MPTTDSGASPGGSSCCSPGGSPGASSNVKPNIEPYLGPYLEPSFFEPNIRPHQSTELIAYEITNIGTGKRY